ncbi:hypothetical protein GS979_08775 [Rhodococcus hoagii]|nr:hypothetical protein [Prescottella equi]NKW46470.1 hypothetical protein [Prescottella equi]
MTDTKLVLDAEYRELIRSLHSETIKTVAAVERWWGECFRAVAIGGLGTESDSDSGSGPDAIEARWRNEVQPRLSTLVHGHPDPDVRDAADFLETRLWSATFLLGERRQRRSDDERTVTIHLAHDGITRLHRAAYHAPFRVERPEPRYEGLSIGRREPLPGKVLEMINQLREAGTLEVHPYAGSDIPAAVKVLSDIFFMPKDERDAHLKGMDVEVPVADASDRERDAPGFGFVRQ